MNIHTMPFQLISVDIKCLISVKRNIISKSDIKIWHWSCCQIQMFSQIFKQRILKTHRSIVSDSRLFRFKETGATKTNRTNVILIAINGYIKSFVFSQMFPEWCYVLAIDQRNQNLSILFFFNFFPKILMRMRERKKRFINQTTILIRSPHSYWSDVFQNKRWVITHEMNRALRGINDNDSRSRLCSCGVASRRNSFVTWCNCQWYSDDDDEAKLMLIDARSNSSAFEDHEMPPRISFEMQEYSIETSG